MITQRTKRWLRNPLFVLVAFVALTLVMAHSLARHAWDTIANYGDPLLNAWILSDGPELEPEDFELPDTVAAVDAGASQVRAVGGAPVAHSLGDHHRLEKDRIVDALTAANWNRAKAAQLVGMPRRTFYRRLKTHGIQ